MHPSQMNRVDRTPSPAAVGAPCHLAPRPRAQAKKQPFRTPRLWASRRPLQPRCFCALRLATQTVRCAHPCPAARFHALVKETVLHSSGRPSEGACQPGDIVPHTTRRCEPSYPFLAASALPMLVRGTRDPAWCAVLGHEARQHLQLLLPFVYIV
jgi:hypothetical protein